MEKTFKFCRGRIYAEVTVELKQKQDGSVLSIRGDLREPSGHSCGQNLDSINEYFGDNPLFQKLYAYWKLYHLNDMNAGCEHQRAMGWGKKRIIIGEYELKQEIYTRKNKILKNAENSLKETGFATITNEEQAIINMPFSIKGEIKPRDGYELKEQEEKWSGWVCSKDHPEGVLTKPCPVCGYQFGSKWLFEPIPQKDLEDIISLIKEKNE